MKITYQEYSNLCEDAINLLLTEEDLQKFNNPVAESALGKVLFYFEDLEEYEVCSDLQDICLEIFGRSIQSTPVKYETEESEA